MLKTVGVEFLSSLCQSYTALISNEGLVILNSIFFSLLSEGNLQFEDEEGEDTAAAPPPPEAEGKAAAPAYSGSTTVVHPYLSSFVNYTHPQKFQVHLTLTHLSEITSDMKKLADDNWIT